MTQESQPSIRSVLRNRHFLLLWLAQALSEIVENATFYVLMVLVAERTGSSSHMSLLILSAAIPLILFGMAAGVYVDRWGKKRVLVTANILRGLAVVGFLALHRTIGWIYLINFLFSTISHFFAVAGMAAIPGLVPRRQLIAANSLLNLTFTGSQLAGFVIVAPFVVKLWGPEPLFVITTFTFLFVISLMAFLPKMEPPNRAVKGLVGTEFFSKTWEELQDGWKLLKSDSAISLSIGHLILTGGLMLVMAMLAPAYVTRVLGIRAADTAYVLAPAGVGILLSILALPHLAGRFPKQRLVNTGLVVMSLSLVCLGLIEKGKDYLLPGFGIGNPEYHTVLVGCVMLLTLVVGVSYGLVNIPAQTIVQERAPVDMRGRIFATQLVFANVACLFPLLFFGGLADLFGVSLVILLIAVIVMAVGGFSLYRSRKLAVSYDE